VNPNLSAAIKAIKKDHPQSYVAEKAKLSVGTLNAILTGGREASREHVAALVQAFSDDNQAQLALVVAHLRDEVAASGVAPERIIIRPTDGADAAALNFDPLCEVWFGRIRQLLHLESQEPKETRVFTEALDSFTDLCVRELAHRADIESRVVQFPLGEKKEEKAKPGHARSIPPIPAPKSTG
jgi:hypothetical protein